MTNVYECTNTSCTLGTPVTPGNFSGGATKEQITMLTGNPEPENHGDGVCPNCGKPGKKLTSVPEPHEGTDPYKKLHKETEARVLDPDDKLKAENAQAEFEKLIEGEGGDKE